MTSKSLILTNMYPSSEKPYAGIYVKNLYRCLQKKSEAGHSFELLAMPRQYTGKIGTLIKYFKFFARSSLHLFKQYKVIHLHFFYPLALWVYVYKLLHPRVKVVVTFHGTDINGHFNTTLSRRVGRALSKPVDYFIAVGESLKTEAEKKLSINVNAVIPAGIDREVFAPSNQGAKQYDLIFVGSFTFQKGIVELVNALNLISSSLNICFVGSGPLRRELRNIKAIHNVTIYENLQQSEIADLYRKSKYLVLPSKSEAFGLVVTEALYCGTPVLVSKVGGIVMQAVEGENGFFFGSISAEDIKSVIDKAVSLGADEYQRISRNAQASNPDFSLDVVTDKHINIYRSLRNEY